MKGLVRRLLKAGVTKVGIERPDGPVVDALLGAGLTVLVIPCADFLRPAGGELAPLICLVMGSFAER